MIDKLLLSMIKKFSSIPNQAQYFHNDSFANQGMQPSAGDAALNGSRRKSPIGGSLGLQSSTRCAAAGEKKFEKDLDPGAASGAGNINTLEKSGNSFMNFFGTELFPIAALQVLLMNLILGVVVVVRPAISLCAAGARIK